MLYIEFFDERTNQWLPVDPALHEGSDPGSFSDNKEDGQRDIYFFKCRGRDSVIMRSSAGLDAEVPGKRVIQSIGSETVALLTDGVSFELELCPDSARGRKHKIRFTHKTKG